MLGFALLRKFSFRLPCSLRPLALHCAVSPSCALHCSALYCGALSCTAPGRVVCHAWLVFWHAVTPSHLASCYMASHKQARFVDVSDRKLVSGLVLLYNKYIVLLRHGSQRGTRRRRFKYV